jgi:hypothetical protein
MVPGRSAARGGERRRRGDRPNCGRAQGQIPRVLQLMKWGIGSLIPGSEVSGVIGWNLITYAGYFSRLLGFCEGFGESISTKRELGKEIDEG